MREIKFRGKRIDNGEWVYGFLYISNISGCYILQCVSFAKKTKEGMNLGDKVVEFEVNPETVGQYTGLKDKNGTEIFEGDVVDYAHPYKNRTGRNVVEWQGYGFGCNGFFQTHYDSPTDAFSEGTEYFEVIGNIHDNPELLGGAK